MPTHRVEQRPVRRPAAVHLPVAGDEPVAHAAVTVRSESAEFYRISRFSAPQYRPVDPQRAARELRADSIMVAQARLRDALAQRPSMGRQAARRA